MAALIFPELSGKIVSYLQLGTRHHKEVLRRQQAGG